MRKSPSRPGFTLYQLLVVIALLAILAGFLAPAIARVREAARRAESQNNLKQIMLSIHNYASNTNRFPMGVDKNGFSAHTHLLPYIEQANLYKSINLQQGVDAKANAMARAALVRTYISPLDPVMRTHQKMGPTNYLFNAGTQASLKNNTGVFYENSRLGFATVIDGTSNTIGVVETLKGTGNTKKQTVARHHILLPAKALNGLKANAGVADFKQGKNIAADRGSSWMDGRFLQGTINAGRLPNDPQPDVSCGGEGGWGGTRSLSSTFHVGMMDGSVRSVGVKLTNATWQNAMNRADGNILGADW